MCNRFVVIVCISLLSSGLSAQRYEFTGDGSNSSWSNNENWKLGAQDPANGFPEKGATADIPAISGLLSAELNSSIQLGALILQPNQQFSLNLDGNTLETNSLIENGATSIIRDGTLIATDGISINDLRVVNTTFTFDGGEIIGSGFALWSITEATNNGVLSLGGTGFASGDASAKFINTNSITKATDSSPVMSMGVPFEQTGGSLGVKTGKLVFNAPATFTGGTIKTEGVGVSSEVIFNGSLSLANTGILLNDGGVVKANSGLTAATITTEGTEGGSFEINAGGERFSVGTFRAQGLSLIVLNSGLQSEDVSAFNDGDFLWVGGELDDFSNANGAEMTISAAGTSGAPRRTNGFLVNNGELVFNGSVSMKALSVIQNEAGGELQYGGGSVSASSGALMQSGLANLGRMTSYVIGERFTVSSRFLNSGTVEIRGSSLSLTGPSQLGGEIVLDPTDSLSPTAATLSVGGTQGVEHLFKNLSFTGLAPSDSGSSARAVFGRGDYKLEGTISSTSAAVSEFVSIHAERGNWINEESAQFDFAESLPLLFGSDNLEPNFQVGAPLENLGYLQIDRASITGSGTFKNSGSIITRRLSVGSGSATGKFVNEGSFTVEGGAFPFVEIIDGSLYTNRDTFVLSDNARIQSPFSATEATFVNEGLFQGAESNRGKQVNLIYKQSGDGSAKTEALSGTLSFKRKAEFENGRLDVSSLIVFEDAVEWGKADSPILELRDGGRVRFAATDKEFKLLDFLVAAGEGSFELAGGRMVPDEGLEGVNFQDGNKLVIAGGTLGSFDTRIDNFGTIEHNQGSLEGPMNSAGSYFLGASGKIETYPVDDLSFSGDMGEFRNLGRFVWNGGTFAGVFKNESPAPEAEGVLELKGGRLIQGSTLENGSLVTQTGALRLESNTDLDLITGDYEMVDFPSIQKANGAVATSMRINSGATLLATAQSSSRGGQLISVDTFELNGGTITSAKSDTTVSAPAIVLNGGDIEVNEAAKLEMIGIFFDTTLDSLTVEEGAIFQPREPSNGIPVSLQVGNFNNKGRVIANVFQMGALDSLSDDQEISSTEPGVIEGDLTQVDGNDLQTVVRTDGTNTSTVNVTGEAKIDGPVYIIGENLGEGSVVPVVKAGSILGTFDGDPIIVSTNPGLTGTFAYTPQGEVIVTISEDTSNNDDLETYVNFVLSYFPPDLRTLTSLWGPTADPDEDGVSNLKEFLLGTNPLDPSGAIPLLHSFELVPEECDGCGLTHLYPEITLNSGEVYKGVEFRFKKLDLEQPDPTPTVEVPALESILPADAGNPKRRVLRGEAPINNGETSGFYEIVIELDEGETAL